MKSLYVLHMVERLRQSGQGAEGRGSIRPPYDRTEADIHLERISAVRPKVHAVPLIVALHLVRRRKRPVERNGLEHFPFALIQKFRRLTIVC